MDDLVIIEFLLIAGLFVLAVIAVLLYERLPRPPQPPPIGFRIHQLDTRRLPMAILGIHPGSTGSFNFTDIPVNAVVPAGVIPQWTSSDPTNAAVTQSADGTTCVVAVPSSAAIQSFDLTVTAKLADGTNPSGTATVPVLIEPTGFVINQTA